MFRKNHKRATRKGQFKVERGSHLKRSKRVNKVLSQRKKKLNIKNIFKLILVIVFILIICDIINTRKQMNQVNSNLDAIIDKLNEITTEQDTITNKQTELEEKTNALEVAKTENKKAEERTNTSTSRSSQERITGSKAEYQNYAKELCSSYGWTEYDFDCIVNIVFKESSWNPNAKNPNSSAYGLFQFLSSTVNNYSNSSYYTDWKEQIRAGFKYIKARYGTPANAWSFWQSHNWY